MQLRFLPNAILYLPFINATLPRNWTHRPVEPVTAAHVNANRRTSFP